MFSPVAYLKESIVRQVWLISSLIGGGILISLSFLVYAWITFAQHQENTVWLDPKLALIFGIFTLIGTWFLTLTTVFLSQSYLSMPLRGLTKILRHYAKQNFNDDIPLTNRGDELGEIARTINILKENSLEGIALQKEREERQSHFNHASSTFKDDASRLFNATDLTSVVDTVHSVTTMGHEVSEKVSYMNHGVQSSSQALEEALNKVDALQAAVQSITSITKVLGEMADQTNLLALNASIEAARAGEAGRGFTVVADAVKKLAEETAKQLKTINTHTQDLQSAGQASKEAVQSLNTALETVSAGSSEITSIMGSQQNLMQSADQTIQSQSQSLHDLAQSISQFLDALQEVNSANL